MLFFLDNFPRHAFIFKRLSSVCICASLPQTYFFTIFPKRNRTQHTCNITHYWTGARHCIPKTILFLLLIHFSSSDIALVIDCGSSLSRWKSAFNLAGGDAGVKGQLRISTATPGQVIRRSSRGQVSLSRFTGVPSARGLDNSRAAKHALSLPDSDKTTLLVKLPLR